MVTHDEAWRTLSEFKHLREPHHGRELWPERWYAETASGVLTDGERVWPVVHGIPYLRIGRRALCEAAAACLQDGNDRGAAAILLTDRDDFAPGEPPTEEATAKVVADVLAPDGIGLREAMDRLNYGPVAHYFAHRASTPTFLSGLTLLSLVLKASARRPNRQDKAGPVAGYADIVEFGCGVGHFLRHMHSWGETCCGIDVVFSKLWLARHRILAGTNASLICADVSAGVSPLGPEFRAKRTFSQDMIYFLPEKWRLVRAMIEVASRAGGVALLGHAHNATADHGGVAGTPLTTNGYADLFAACGAKAIQLFDDAALTTAAVTLETLSSASNPVDVKDAEAIGLMIGAWADWDEVAWAGARTLPADGTPLSVNPLLAEEDGVLKPDWPMPRFAEEYRSATYLTHEIAADERAIIDAARAEPVAMDAADAVVERLARRRVLLDVPERW